MLREGRCPAVCDVVVNDAWSSRRKAASRWLEVGLRYVPVEDREYLDGCAASGDPVRNHGVELGGVADRDEAFVLTEHGARGAVEGGDRSRPGWTCRVRRSRLMHVC